MLLFHACQALIQPLKFEREAFVINSHAMQDGCIQIIQMGGILGDVVTEIIGLTMGYPCLDASTRKPHAEISGVMITPIVVLGQGAL